MKHSTIKRLLSLLLVLVFTLALFPAGAYADLQDEIDALRKERLEIAEEHEQKQAVVDQLEEERAGLLERKQAMDERNELTRKEIENIEKEIELYDQMIAEAAIRVEQAKAVETEQLERYRVHVRAMEENGELGYLALILNANSLSELLTAVDDAGDIMRSDVELYDAYIAAREHTEEVKAEYEQTRSELGAKQDELRAQQEELEAEIEEASRLISELDEDIEKRNEELHELLLAEIATAERIDNLVAEQERQRQEAERQRQQESGNNGGNNGGSTGGNTGGGSVTATGSFGWPCPGCYYVTSRFGNRFHPIFNEWRYHSGMDIGASYGSSVVASDSGTVVMAEVNGGYGNCIMINHGNGYYTLYGHLSGYAVSSGQEVSKGQTIGYVGDTGWATGPHLHFEIRQGNTKLDPETTAGFSGLSYAPDAGE